MSSITGTVTTTVILDETTSPLDVESGAQIAPVTGAEAGIQGTTPNLFLSNYGTVSGAANGIGGTTAGVGVDLRAATTVTNGVGGVIAGGVAAMNYGESVAGGVGLRLNGGSAYNFGFIGGGSGAYAGNGGTGVSMHGGSLVNEQSGTHFGAILGGDSFGYGGGGVGLAMNGGNAVNGTGASITGGGMDYPGNGGSGGAGVNLVDGAELFNHGAVTGGYSRYGTGGTGVIIRSGGDVTNPDGTITGGDSRNADGGLGVSVASGGMLYNRGTIAGASESDSSTGLGGDGVDVSGGTFINAGTIKGGSAENGGGAGLLLNGGTVTNTGTIQAGRLNGHYDAYGVEFGTQPGTLKLGDGSRILGGIDGFKAGDTVDFTNLSVAQVEADFSKGTITTPHDGTVVFDGDAGDTFSFKSDGAVGTDVTVGAAACYRRGTRIMTASGEVAIERLRIGDEVMTRTGVMRPVRWIGRRSYTGEFATANPDVLPVRIAAGALGEDVPSRDLWVSPEHAMYLDERLVPARALVNGSTIVKESAVAEVTYLHIEFETHDVVIAEGAFSESYVDDESREQFVNAPEYHVLYPGAVRRAARFCAPRTEDGEILETIRRRINLRAQAEADPQGEPGAWRGHLDAVRRDLIEGWARDEDHPDLAVELRILDNGVPLGEVVARRYRADLAEAGIGDGRHAFSLPVAGGLAPEIRHVIEVNRVDDGRPLAGSPFVLEAFDLAVAAPEAEAAQPESATPEMAKPEAAEPKFSKREAAKPEAAVIRTLTPATWAGHLDSVTHERLEGWAWNHATPEAPLALVVLDNGEPVARVLANRYRKDLADAGIGDGHHSFSLIIPGGLSPLSRHVIQVVGEADGCEMRNSPFVLGESNSFDGALETAVTTAVATVATPDDRERVLSFLAAQAERVLQLGAQADAHIEARLIQRHLDRSGETRRADASSSAARRALVVDDRMPVAGMDAGANAILSHMHALKTLGYEVTFVAADELAPTAAAIAALESEGFRCCVLPFYASVEEVLRRQADGFDVIYLHRVSNAAKYLAMARQHDRRARIVYGVADLHHIRLERQAKVEGRPDVLAQSHRLRFSEYAGAGTADAVITHSSAEAQWLRHAVKGTNVHVVPWSVPVRPVETAWTERHGIAFIGNFAFAPNGDAARFLVNEVMPRVWETNPSIECRLVGSRMGEDIRRLAGPKVLVTGEVADLDEVFNSVRLTVAPLRFGAGVKGKVLDSLAAGVPCVMSPIAAEGIDLPAALATIGETAAELAAAIVRLHSDETGAAVTAAAAVAFIRDRYSEAMVVEGLRSTIEGRQVEGSPVVTLERRLRPRDAHIGTRSAVQVRREAGGEG